MIYLDNSATTKVSEKVAQKAYMMMTEKFGNPSSLHSKGFEAELEIKESRRTLAKMLGCKETELFFTSGGTEANNTAIIGTAMAKVRRGKKIVVSSIEHSSVLEAADFLSKNGFEVVKLSPDKNAQITFESVADAVDENTTLVSVMLVNNEVGSIMDIATIAAAARRKNPNVTVHCDAVQAFGKIPVNVNRLGVDLLSVSAHKIHAIKGTGALFVKKGTRINPIIFGGEQQNKLRPGTENAVGIVAFSQAAADAGESMAKNYAKVKELCSYLKSELLKLDGVKINSPDNALPYVLNFSTCTVRSETMLHFLEKYDICVSSGSACAKGIKSHVLSAMMLSPRQIDTAIRVSFCKDNTKNDVDALIEGIKQAQKSLQKIN